MAIDGVFGLFSSKKSSLTAGPVARPRRPPLRGAEDGGVKPNTPKNKILQELKIKSNQRILKILTVNEGTYRGTIQRVKIDMGVWVWLALFGVRKIANSFK